jgi:hypothetical protein
MCKVENCKFPIEQCVALEQMIRDVFRERLFIIRKKMIGDSFVVEAVVRVDGDCAMFNGSFSSSGQKPTT